MKGVRSLKEKQSSFPATIHGRCCLHSSSSQDSSHTVVKSLVAKMNFAILLDVLYVPIKEDAHVGKGGKIIEVTRVTGRVRNRTTEKREIKDFSLLVRQSERGRECGREHVRKKQRDVLKKGLW